MELESVTTSDPQARIKIFSELYKAGYVRNPLRFANYIQRIPMDYFLDQEYAKIVLRGLQKRNMLTSGNTYESCFRPGGNVV